ncbi:MAG: hypothetical protein M3Z32_01145 [Acidobacteriota bacterium]|nr:hypothetical protein [Acidobacteriota bacterium]
MRRKNGSHRLSGMLLLLSAGAFTESCKKHQSASIPANIPAPAPAPQRVPRARRAQAPSTTPAPASSSGPTGGTPAAAPQLGQILSASEQRQYNALIDQSLSQTRSNLDGLANRKLTPEQANSVRTIQEFMQQANTARKVDLISAKALADKAQVLALDLVRNVK